jgi:hypothetical protein
MVVALGVIGAATLAFAPSPVKQKSQQVRLRRYTDGPFDRFLHCPEIRRYCFRSYQAMNSLGRGPISYKFFTARSLSLRVGKTGNYKRVSHSLL